MRRLSAPPFDALDSLFERREGPDPATRDAVRRILDRVRSHGDAAVREYTLEFDGVDLDPRAWPLDPGLWQEALQRIEPGLRAALGRAVDRVRSYHEHQRESGFHLTQPDGSVIGMRVTPLDRVGLYVPGGKASYPSSVIMNAVPAVVAGVQEIIAVVPPGGVTDGVLGACALSGVTRIFRVGGAQAVAAMAYGTATIPRVDKVVGPGNRWVAEAKRQVVGEVGIDMIAGPTEVLILADATARPARVAADLVAQAEHDEDAVCWCVTTDAVLADTLPSAVEEALARSEWGHRPRARYARRDRGGQPARPGASRDRRRGRGAGCLVGAPRGRHLPGGREPGARRRLHRRTESRPSDQWVGAVRVATRRVRFRQAHQHHPLHEGTPRRRREAIIALAEAEGLYGHAEAVRVRVAGLESRVASPEVPAPPVTR